MIRPSMVKAAVDLAEKIAASSIIIISDSASIPDIRTSIPILISPVSGDLGPSISREPVTEASKRMKGATERGLRQLQDIALTAYASGQLREGPVVGLVESSGAMGIIVFDPRETPTMKSLDECAERVDPEVIRMVLAMAGELGREGREGETVGTAFVVGDAEEVLMRSHQLILNPFKGHAEEDVLITNEENWETIKEFSLLDGVFVLDEKGHILAAGRYLDVDAKDLPIQKGLGGRHIAAAAISRDTQAIAVTVSESGGAVRVYKDGKQIMKVEPSKVLRGIGGR